MKIWPISNTNILCRFPYTVTIWLSGLLLTESLHYPNLFHVPQHFVWFLFCDSIGFVWLMESQFTLGNVLPKNISIDICVVLLEDQSDWDEWSVASVIFWGLVVPTTLIFLLYCCFKKVDKAHRKSSVCLHGYFSLIE